MILTLNRTATRSATGWIVAPAAAFTAGFRPAVVAAAALALAGAIAAGFLPGRRTAETAGVERVAELVSDGVGAGQPQP